LDLGEDDSKEEIMLVACQGTKLHEAQLLRFNARMRSNPFCKSFWVGWMEMLAEGDEDNSFLRDESGTSLI
jgi:hypothetical protein